MLILTRRIGEKITVGDNIEVTVLGKNGNQISIGIDAPRNVRIVRNEILDKYPKNGNKYESNDYKE